MKLKGQLITFGKPLFNNLNNICIKSKLSQGNLYSFTNSINKQKHHEHILKNAREEQVIYFKNLAQKIIKHEQQREVKTNTIQKEHIKLHILIFQKLTSTMLLSEKWQLNLLQDNQSFLFSTKIQTQGRGQRKNTWTSPQGNIYFTILTKQPISLIPYLWMVSAVSVSNVLQTNLQMKQIMKFKWINDIYLNNKKFAGILIKTDLQQSHVYAQIGIGINVNTAPNQQYTFLRQHLIKNHQFLSQNFIKKLIQLLGESILINLSKFNQNKSRIMNKYNQRLMMKGQIVNIFDANLKQVITKGKFIGINDFGHAMIQTEKGLVKVIDGRMRLAI